MALLLVPPILAIILLAMPGDALAWGPGVHLAASRFVLSNLDMLPAALAALLDQHQNFFLYGSLSADFLVGKGSTRKPGHSHNWESGFCLLEQARSRRLKAYSLGYLTHLAADVVAHNYYVPSVLARTRLSGPLTHVYVEAQADSRLTGGLGMKVALPGRGQRAADLTLAHALHKDFFALSLRKRLFRSGVSLSKGKTWNNSLRLAQLMLPLPDAGCGLADMFELSLRAVFDVLRQPRETVVQEFDPIGTGNLAQVRKHRMAWRSPLEPFEPDDRLTALPQIHAPRLPKVA